MRAPHEAIRHCDDAIAYAAIRDHVATVARLADAPLDKLQRLIPM